MRRPSAIYYAQMLAIVAVIFGVDVAAVELFALHGAASLLLGLVTGAGAWEACMWWRDWWWGGQTP
jgi:hypothetical protein